MDTEAVVRRFLKERFGAYRDDLAPTDPLEAVVDSMGLFELVSFVEQEFAVTIPGDEFSPRLFATIEAIVQVVERFGGGGS
jgi:acyl carrier protein